MNVDETTPSYRFIPLDVCDGRGPVTFRRSRYLNIKSEPNLDSMPADVKVSVRRHDCDREPSW